MIILLRHDHGNTNPRGAAHVGLRQLESHTLSQVRLRHSLAQPYQNINENQDGLHYLCMEIPITRFKLMP